MRWVILLALLGLLLANGCRAAAGEGAEGEEEEEDLPGTVDADPGASREALRTDDEVVQREEEAIKLDGLSVAEMKELRERAEKHAFQAEVNRMMKLIINSLYRNKEIFLRELISNASDALDKIRFLSLTDKSSLRATEELSIKIRADKESGMLHVTDTGIGMTREDLEKNLGTIAKSGTTEFFDKLQEVEDSKIASDLIGQFGVGFYSSFLVSDTVIVTSKHNDDEQYIWESDANSFSIAKDPRGPTLLRGTTISLVLKEEAKEYLEANKLRSLITKYSQFINFPIYIWWEKTTVEEVPIEEGEEVKPEGEGEGEGEVEDEEATVADDEEEKPKTKSVEKVTWDWDLVNDTKPIWLRSHKEVTDEEYNKFYEVFSKNSDSPIAKTHFTAEGEVTFKSILFVPPRAPADMITNYGRKSHQIKLYVRRVFITDDFEDILPNYLSFVCGVVDSDDLPLNVSRETLQQHKLLKVIRKKLVRKVLDMLKKLDKEDYEKFWKEFGTSMKLGVMEDTSNKTRLSKLLRFYSSHNTTELTSLQEYVERMKETQEHIYYIAGSSKQEVEASPFAERLLLKGYEVLYLIDAVDEYTIQNIPDFESKKLQNVAKEGLEFGDEGEREKENLEEIGKAFEPLTEWLKQTALTDKIEKAVVSNRLSNSPCAIVAGQFGWSGNMERIARAQAHYVTGKDPSMDFYYKQPKTLEVNPRHPLIKEMLRKVEGEETDQTTIDLAEVLYETALLRSGYSLPDSTGFAGRIEKMLRLSMGVDLEAEIEQEEFPSEEDFEEVGDEEEEVGVDEGEEEEPVRTVPAEPVTDDDIIEDEDMQHRDEL